jgi:hypothetical protein
MTRYGTERKGIEPETGAAMASRLGGGGPIDVKRLSTPCRSCLARAATVYRLLFLTDRFFRDDDFLSVNLIPFPK